MNKDDAIKYLKQLYPNGGHCWLDEQRIEAIGMAIKALQKEPVSEDLEKAAVEAFKQIVDSDKNSFLEIFKAGAKWQKQQILDCNITLQRTFDLGKQEMKQQLMAKAVDATVHIDAGGYPYIPQTELYDYDKDTPLAKKGDKYKVILIKED